MAQRPYARPRLAPWAIACTLLFGAILAPGSALAKDKFRVAWSIYAGWMPWDYAGQSGIVKKWADKYGIAIEVVQINDYVESINQYAAGAFDGCVMTNMDALTIPAAGGLDTTALIVGDFSNGNDAVILKGKSALKDIKGQQVNLVELSVSHYLLARGLGTVGLSEKNIKVVNTSDADMVAAFGAGGVTAVVTWNPLVSEILAIMSNDDAAGKAARTAMGKASGTDLAGYDAQLATTRMFYKAADAVAFATSPALPETMKHVAQFSFDHGLLGEGAADAGVVGIAFPDGKVQGNPANLKLRFDAEYMRMAAEGKL
jgi:NitT/TauT family transport system substrate-binding protein